MQNIIVLVLLESELTANVSSEATNVLYLNRPRGLEHYTNTQQSEKFTCCR